MKLITPRYGGSLLTGCVGKSFFRIFVGLIIVAPMKTYLSDIIPRIQRFSRRLDNTTLLTRQPWVVIDETTNTRLVYFFRSEGEILISLNGKAESARWELLGDHSLLIRRSNENIIFKHGFFDENILALKLYDNREEFAFLVNENRYDDGLNSIEGINRFLQQRYLPSEIPLLPEEPEIPKIREKYSANNGELELKIIHDQGYYPFKGDEVFIGENPAPDGKYKLGFLSYIYIDYMDVYYGPRP